MILQNESDLTKDFPNIKNPKYQTPKWVGWFNLIYLLGSIPGAAIIAHLLYTLKIFAPNEWQQFLNDQYGLIVIPLFFPIFTLLTVLFNYLSRKFLIKELFTGETDYIIAYQENINLENILKIRASNIPPNTKLHIFAYNRQQEVKLTKRFPSRFSRGYWKGTQSAVEEAKTQGINLDIEQYPIMNIERNEKSLIGNVNHIETIDLPPSTKATELQAYLPAVINLKNTPVQLLIPNFDGHILTELAIRVTVHCKNEYTTSFDVFLNPMETAFAVEI